MIRYVLCTKHNLRVSSVGGAYIFLDGLGWDSPKPFEAPFVDYNNFDFIAEIKKYVGSN